MDQESKDAKYERYSIIGLFTGLFTGYYQTKKFGMMMLYGFGGMGLTGAIAYIEITYFRS